MSNSVFRKYPLPLVISTVMFILPLLTSSLVTAWAISHEDWWAALSLEKWVLITTALALASALALIPPGFLALLYGYFLGWIGLPLLVLMNTIAIGAVYGLGKKIISPHFLGYLQEAYPSAAKVLLRFHQDPIRLIFFTKLSPVLPFAITNLLFTLAGARLPQMVLGGTLGMIPRTILSLWIGTQAKEIHYLMEHPNEGLGTQLLIVGLVLLSTAGIGWYFKKKQ